jgi:hypothetical protein
MKNKVNEGTIKYKQMIDSFNEQRAALKKRFQRNGEAPFEMQDELKSIEHANKFRQRNKSVQPSLRGYINRNLNHSQDHQSIGPERRTSVLPSIHNELN